MKDQLLKLQETCRFLSAKTNLFQPKVGVVLGTGLGDLSKHVETVHNIPYAEIPHFPESTVESHAGELIFAKLGDVQLVIMAGRFHYYEGYSMQEVTFPIRVLKFLGVQNLLLSNAVGSVVPHLQSGQITCVKDHINLHVENPLRGENIDEFGPRFPDLSKTYDLGLRALAQEEAAVLDLTLPEVVYAGIPGPNLETPAESRYLNLIGGEVVGMSTIPEVLVAKHMDLPVLVFSVVTNQNYPFDEIAETTLEKVVEVAKEATPRLTKLVLNIIQKLG